MKRMAKGQQWASNRPDARTGFAPLTMMHESDARDGTLGKDEAINGVA
jgi:hypothetical protein